MIVEFDEAVVMGTGVMGPGIAATLATGGMDVGLFGRTPESTSRGLDSARRQLALLFEHGLAKKETAGRIEAAGKLEASIASADLVIESVPEDLGLKQELFARLDTLAKPDAVLATNTSALSVTAIAAQCRRPERVLTTHFWNPPHLMPLVEVVRGEKTSPGVAEAARDLLVRCGKVPVMVKKDRPGQLGNRLQYALQREAIHIVQEGIADAEEVDLAARFGFGLRLPAYGILEHVDIVSLDFVVRALDYTLPDLNNQSRAPSLLRDSVAQGRLGVKAGKGFYDWSAKNVDEVRGRRDSFVLRVVKDLRGRERM